MQALLVWDCAVLPRSPMVHFSVRTATASSEGPHRVLNESKRPAVAGLRADTVLEVNRGANRAALQTPLAPSLRFYTGI